MIAVFGDWHAVHEFHDEVRPARLRGAGVENAGNIDMVHHRQRLPFGLKTGDDLPGVHAGFDYFNSNSALHRMCLLSHEHAAHAAFADLLQQLVRANDGARAFADAWWLNRGTDFRGGRIEETTGLLVSLQKYLHALA